MNVYIFGAHSRAQTLAIYLKTLYKDIQVEAFLYNNDEPNPNEVDEIPVINISGYDLSGKNSGEVTAYNHTEEASANNNANTISPKLQLDTDNTVYLGVRSVYHKELISILENIGFKNIIPVTPALDMELRNAFLKQYFEKNNQKYIKIEDEALTELDNDSMTNTVKSAPGLNLSSKIDNIGIYVIKSAFDSALSRNDYFTNAFEKDIQVGCALTSERVADICDNVGENISDRNKQFCELTGLYWIWKHAKEDIVGLEHYRRHFILPDNWKDILSENNIDVILPTPLYVHPSLANNYRDRHVKSDWEFMMGVVKELYPSMYESAMNYFEKTAIYSPCNMFIMKKAILDEYCDWLFPILFKCSDHIGQREDKYQNRYPGFMSERLLSFYFDFYKDKYNIIYADKDFRQ